MAGVSVETSQLLVDHIDTLLSGDVNTPIEISGVDPQTAHVVDKLEDIRKLIAQRESRIGQFRRALDHTRAGVAVTDETGHIQFVNGKWSELHNYESGERLHDTITVFFESAFSEKDVQRIIQKVQSSDEGYTGEHVHVRKDGSAFPVALSVYSAPNPEDDKKEVFTWTIDDLTDIKEKELKLREAETFLTSIIENIPDMIFVKDAKELRFVRFNRAGEELLGYSRDDLLGKNDYDFFPKDQADAFTKKDREVFDGRAVVDIPQEEIETKSGKRVLHTKKVPMFNSSGKPEYLLGISEDITEHQQHTTQLVESEQRFKQVFDNASVGIALVDSKGRPTMANQYLQDMLGYTQEELSGKTFAEFTHPDDIELDVGLYEELIAGKRDSYEIEKRYITKSGNTVMALLKVSVVTDAEGNIKYAIGMVDDITEKKKSQSDLAEKVKELERMNHLMIGREGRMVELKKEIETLKKQLKQ